MLPAGSTMRAVLLGPPNSGKGVAGDYLTTTLGIPCVSTGQLLRAEIEAGTETGVAIKSELDAGHFAPDDLVQSIVRGFLSLHQCFTLDGFPRNVPQAEWLQGELGLAGKALNIVIYLHVDDAVIVERAITRLTCAGCRRVTSTRYNVSGVCEVCGGRLFRRDDDTEETVRERLGVYREQTYPLIEFYRGLGLLEQIDGSETIPELHSRLDTVAARFPAAHETA